MKHFVLVGALLLLFGSMTAAQAIDNAEALKKFGLNEEEIERVMEIQNEMDRIIQETRIELNLLKAQLEKLLFDVNVDMQKVERILRESIEWKLKSELAEIKRRIEIRKIFGEQRWQKFLRARKRWGAIPRKNPPDGKANPPTP
jgi:hypothetical protein